MTNLDSILKRRDITLLTKICIVKAMVFLVVMYRCELEHTQGWALKNGCFRMVMVEKTLESPLNFKETKQVNPKGNQSWIVIGRTDSEAKAPILWPHDLKNWLTGKDPDAGKDRWQEEEGTIEDEMVGWHHQFNGHDFEQVPGGSEEQGSLACCNRSLFAVNSKTSRRKHKQCTLWHWS